jgi:cytochrome c553
MPSSVMSPAGTGPVGIRVTLELYPLERTFTIARGFSWVHDTMLRGTIAAGLGTLLLTAATGGAGAADLTAGKTLVEHTCYACHGVNGMSHMSLYPNLAGQKRRYLEAELRAFRDGSRKNPIMSLIAAHLTNAQIRDVSAYFASLEPGKGALCAR